MDPLARFVAAIGIAPRSSLMKGAHVALGLLWLAAVAGFGARLPWGWWGILGCAVASLWYIPLGTLIGIIQVTLLLMGLPERTPVETHAYSVPRPLVVRSISPRTSSSLAHFAA
jgi:hypothetical protein